MKRRHTGEGRAQLQEKTGSGAGRMKRGRESDRARQAGTEITSTLFNTEMKQHHP